MKIEARGIRFRAGDADILTGIDLTVSGGEMLGLIGPNGAGKTTLLRLLAGLLEPAEGEILFDGHAAADLDSDALARRLAYLAQGSMVHWPLQVEAIVALGRLPHRQRFNGLSASDREAIAAAMAEADIAALRHRSFDTLSGGEQRRVLLARALAVQADILLADEPGAALDPYHHLQVMELLGNTARRGTGIAVVLHDLSMAARFCDRLILLDRGRVVADGRPEEVLSDRHIAEVYRVSVERGSGATPFVIPRQRI